MTAERTVRYCVANKEMEQVMTKESNVFDFYRCASCQGLITRQEEIAGTGKEPTSAGVCACGASRYSPTNPLGNPPDDGLNPGDGAALELETAVAVFDRAMLYATGEWQLSKVREWAWRLFRGIP